MAWPYSSNDTTRAGQKGKEATLAQTTCPPAGSKDVSYLGALRLLTALVLDEAEAADDEDRGLAKLSRMDCMAGLSGKLA